MVVFTLGLSVSAQANPAVLLYPALGTPRELTVSGTVLQNAPTLGSSTFSKNLRRLAVQEWVGAEVEVTFQGQRMQTRSGSGGRFEVTFTSPETGPYPVGSAFAEAHVSGASAHAQVQIVSDEAPFVLISDFDDTVAISDVLRLRRVLRSALFQDEVSQAVVPGMAPFYQCLLSEKGATPGLAVVSGSPREFAARMAAFLRLKGFPFAGLYLRNLAPATLSNYKQPVLRNLLKHFPHPVVLVGDSGEHDPEVYAQVRAEFPDRIRRIYIRDAGRAENKKRFAGMVLFKNAADAAKDATEQGLMSEQCLNKTFPAVVER